MIGGYSTTRTALGLIAALAVAVAIAACGTSGGPSAGTQSPATPSPITQQPSATPAGSVGSAAPPSIAVGPSTSASALGAELISPGRLVMCIAFNRTRFAERDADGKPFGVDVEIGEAIAAELALEPEILDVPFDEVIDTVVARACDVSIAGHFITQDRLARIDMIPYREGAPHVIVPKGNPLGINEAVDLCGRSFAVVATTVYVDMVRGAGDYVGEGINDVCLDAGHAPVDLREFPDQQKAEAALIAGDVNAYAGNEALAAERPGEFELTFELPRARNGIGHRLDAPVLDTFVREALRTLIADGRYLAILERYGAQSGALTITP